MTKKDWAKMLTYMIVSGVIVWQGFEWAEGMSDEREFKQFIILMWGASALIYIPWATGLISFKKWF